MTESINMFEFIKDLSTRPRGRACIILTREYEKKTIWAEKLAQKTGSLHLNLLELFSNDEKLHTNLELFTLDDLFKLLKKFDEHPVLLVTGIEFLKAIWPKTNDITEHLARRIETWTDKPALLFIMKYDEKLCNYNFKRHPQYKFVIEQNKTIAL